MQCPEVLVVAGFLIARQAEWNPGLELIAWSPQANPLAVDVAERIEVVVCAGELASELIDALPNLKLVACFSTGYSGIDVDRLRRRGVKLTTAAGINAHDVADHALALLLSLWHGIPAGDRAVREGGWRTPAMSRSSLRGRRAGIAGLGRIGSAIAIRLASHELETRWWGPHPKPDCKLVRAESLLALAEWCDILVVASRAVAANRHQINAEVLAALGSKGVLVNVSRGLLVDEQALIAALQAGTIAGAALDVFATEPPPAAQWRAVPNLVLTPHLAGFTHEAGSDMFGQLRENLRRFFAGESLLGPLEL